MLTLYQFPISHYCEKVRWALDHKKLGYRIHNLLPGLHSFTTKNLAGSSMVPVLVDSGQVVQNSRDIIDYLDTRFPELTLTPVEPGLRKEALYWEQFADERIGLPVRAICYHTLLDYPSVLIPLWIANGPWYGRLVMPLIYPKLSQAMREIMKLEPRAVAAAHQGLAKAIDQLAAHVKDRQFLVGDRFSRADIAVAALLAPLCKAQKFGVEWPTFFPDPLEASVASYKDKLVWVERMYADYR